MHPYIFLDKYSSLGWIYLHWTDVTVPDENDISYRKARHYFLKAGSQTLSLMYVSPTKYSALSVSTALISHPSKAQQSHKEVIQQLLEFAEDVLRIRPSTKEGV